MICKNCNNNFEGKFCNDCGQKASVKQVNFRFIINEITNTLFQFDHGLFFTIKELFTRPGNSIREYLDGKRVNHIKPLSFNFIIAAFLLLISQFVGEKNYLSAFLAGISDGLHDDPMTFNFTIKIFTWMVDNYAYTNLILIPIFAFASFLVFKNAGYNYFEHLVLKMYISGQQIVINCIFIILFLMIKNNQNSLQLIPIILSGFFTFWTFVQFFKINSNIKKVILTVFTYSLYFLFIIILLVAMLIIELIQIG